MQLYGIFNIYLNEHIEHYHKQIWWQLERDKLYMMLDSIYVLGPEDGRSVASVVEREPIAILGNSLVYRAAAGAFLRVDGHEVPPPSMPTTGTRAPTRNPCESAFPRGGSMPRPCSTVARPWRNTTEAPRGS